MEKTAREMFLGRLHGELQRFKESMPQKDKESIYSESYRIEVFINLYEILAEQAGQMQEALLLELAGTDTGILESLYLSWLGKEDSFYTELAGHAKDGMDMPAQAGKDGTCGKHDKAA